MPNLPTRNTENKGLRLNRYLANSGVCTRREADKLIAKGLVEVEGRVITEMGYRVQPGEEVKYLGRVQRAEAKRYILLNKPKAYAIKNVKEGKQRSVHDIVKKACCEMLIPADSMAEETSGVLLMSNDRDFIQKISSKKQEIYHLFLDNEMRKDDLKALRGMSNFSGKNSKISAADFANKDDKREVGIELTGALNNPLPMILKNLGYKIERLDRVMFAGLTKKNIARGQWRFLSHKEVQFLKML